MVQRLLLLSLYLATPTSILGRSSWTEGLFDGRAHNFGNVQRGAELQHDFLLTNNQSRALRIRDIEVSCGCVRVVPSTRELAPGETAVLKTTLATARFKGDKSVTIYVRFDRPHRAETSLRLHCHIVEASAQDAREVDFGFLTEGSPAEKRLHLDYVGKSDWHVVGLDYGNPHVRTEIQEMSRQGGRVRYELRIAITESAPPGPLTDKIRIHTNDSRNSPVIVSAKAQIQPKLVVLPNTLRLNDLKPGESVKKRLCVKGPQPFRIVRAEETGGMIEVRSSDCPKTTQVVELTLTVPEDADAISDHIRFVTDLAGEQTVSVKIQK